MKPIQIAEAYDQITHLWLSEKFNRDNGIKAHQRAIRYSTQKGFALDVGCGCTGRFIDLLIEHQYQPEGLDLSTKKIALAKKRHPEVTFYHEDICRWQLPKKYDFITAWDSLWHIPLQEQKPVLSKLVAGLNKQGVMILSFGAVDDAGEHTDDFMGPEVYYSSLGTAGFLSVFDQLGCRCLHLELDQFPEPHAYMIVQKR